MKDSNYGLYESMLNGFQVILSRFLIPGSRMIRFPITIRGKQYIDFGSKLTTGKNCRIEVHGKQEKKCLVFGDHVNIGDHVSIRCAHSIYIGNHVLMGSKVLILDNSHGRYTGEIQDSPRIPPNQRPIVSAPVVIEDNVWIGENAVIQKGVTVGFGSIVAASSVVTRDVPPMCMVAGIPAKVIKKYDETEKKWIQCSSMNS